mmetsp:Transcript_4253/g.12818  ORF Transcript_4253/g.12818 Transcript_4253/m.12818 type:complete len:84 (+) Transcript_4253:1518-1769(+)
MSPTQPAVAHIHHDYHCLLDVNNLLHITDQLVFVLQPRVPLRPLSISPFPSKHYFFQVHVYRSHPLQMVQQHPLLLLLSTSTA